MGLTFLKFFVSTTVNRLFLLLHTDCCIVVFTEKEIPKPNQTKVQSPKSQPAKPGSKQNKTETSKQKAQAKSESTAKSQQKSPSKDHGHGMPPAPKAAPKLDKATPYEFISAWNALKKSESVKPYYDLLKQVKPEDIKTGK